MTQKIVDQPVTDDSAVIPQDWIDELALLNPRSHEYGEMLAAMKALGYNGVRGAEEVEVTDIDLPPGFKSSRIVPAGGRLPASQFEGRVYAMDVSDAEDIDVDIIELVTDRNNVIRVCDLRGRMVNATQGFAPKTEAEKRKLDKSFWLDMKAYADNDNLRPRNVVENAEGIFYTKAPKSKLRSYWTLVEDKNNEESVRTVARFADCGDNEGYEARLYRRVLHMQL